jgi:hypothetical protein
MRPFACAFVCMCGLLVVWCSRDDGVVALAATGSAAAAPTDPPVATARARSLADTVGPVVATERTEVPDAVELPAPVDSDTIAALVEALRDDDIPGNGLAAFAELCRQPPGAVAALDAALQSFDRQQRGFAAAILRVRCEDGLARPGDGLLAASVDDLGPDSDRFLCGSRGWPRVRSALRLLCDHGERAAPWLRRALDSVDDGQRQLAAFALAPHANDVDAARIVRVLAPHLADNEIGGDALFAGHGLYRLGRRGLPALREWRPFTDGQAVALIDLVTLDLATPPRTRAELRARSRMHGVTSVYHDPVVEFDFERSSLPRE